MTAKETAIIISLITAVAKCKGATWYHTIKSLTLDYLSISSESTTSTRLPSPLLQITFQCILLTPSAAAQFVKNPRALTSLSLFDD